MFWYRLNFFQLPVSFERLSKYLIPKVKTAKKLFQILFVAVLSFQEPFRHWENSKFYKWYKGKKTIILENSENEISQIGYKMHFTLIFTPFSSKLSRTEYHPGDFENKCLLLTFTVHFFKQAKHSQKLR